tara:strand:- start:274 stop:468 length:195 start_codon:yes stop_codon:yes gene_type:complete
MTDADLRRALSRPASLGDILEAWMMTNPRKGKSHDASISKAALRRDMKKTGASDSGLDFWFGGS